MTQYVRMFNEDYGDTIGVAPSGFSKRGAGSVFTQKVQYGALSVVGIGRSYFLFGPNSAGSHEGLSFDAVTGDANNKDFDILTMAIPAVATNAIRLIARGQEGIGAAMTNYYRVQYQESLGGVFLQKIVTGAISNLTTTVQTPYTNINCYIRYRCSTADNLHKVRVWPLSAGRVGEPKTVLALNLTGSASAYASTPDSANASVTVDPVIIVKVQLASYAPAGNQMLCTKLLNVGQYGYDLYLDTSNHLVFRYSLDGTTIQTITSAALPVSFGPYSQVYFKIAHTNSSGNTDFSYSFDDTTYTAIGTTVAGATGALKDGTDELRIGANSGNPVTGNVLRLKILSGSTLKVDFNPPVGASAGATSFSSATGETWTINGSASIKVIENWDIQMYDNSITSTGWIGVGAQGTGTTHGIPFFSVGTNGDVAPCPRTNWEKDLWRQTPNLRNFLVEVTGVGYDPTNTPIARMNMVGQQPQVIVSPAVQVNSSGYPAVAPSDTIPFTKTVKMLVSTMGFVTQPYDVNPNTYYPDIVLSIPTFSRSLSIGQGLMSGPIGISFGSLTLKNSKSSVYPAKFTTMGVYLRGTKGISMGADRVSVNQNFTVEGWVNPANLTEIYAQNIFNLFNGGGVYCYLGVGVGGFAYFSHHGGINLFANNVISPKTMTHVAATGDGTTITLYVNGVAVASVTQAYSNVSGGGMYCYIGGTGSPVMNSSFDEVRVWSVCRTPSQIASYMKVRAIGNETGLVNCWHLDEGTGTTTKDSGPGNVTGTLLDFYTMKPDPSLWSFTGMPRPSYFTGNWGGEWDDLLRVRFNREPLTVLWGDPSWPRMDYTPFIRGRIDQPTAPSIDVLNFTITDMSSVFNALLEPMLTNGPYYPKLMGFMGGMLEPPCVDSNKAIYQISDGPITGMQAGTFQTNVYDNLVLLQTGEKTVSGGGVAATNKIPCTAHGMVTGYRLVFRNDGSHAIPTATPVINFNTHYWVIRLDADNFSIALTKALALASTAITLTNGTGGLCPFTGYGYDIDEVAGTVTLAAAPVGRITVDNVKNNNNLASGYTNAHAPAHAVDTLIFGNSGLKLSRNRQDAANFLAMDAADTGKNQAMGVWMDSQKHTYADALNELARVNYLIWGFTQDGLMQINQLGLPSATALFSLTEDDVIELKQIGGIRSVDFSKTAGYGQKWYVGSGVFVRATPAATAMGTVMNVYTYGDINVPLDNYPPATDSDATTEFRCACQDVTTNGQGARWLRDQIVELYRQRLGVFEFKATAKAMHPDLTIGSTIQLTHSRLGFKVYGPEDPVSPDNISGTPDMTKMVVTGISVNVASGGVYPVTITGYRRIPGFLPITDLTT